MMRSHPSPLRYPGGKSFLTSFLADAIRLNGIDGGVYIEPCAGGAGAALNLLFSGYVSSVHINDADPCIFSFWKSVVYQSETFLELLEKTPVNVRTWRRQREIIRSRSKHSHLNVGFAVFYLNRCNRSGALNGGPIGGLDQTGAYKIDARFNKIELRKRIEKIFLHRDRISVSGKNAITFLREKQRKGFFEANRAIVYLDPPYHAKGQRLYSRFFRDSDHRALAKFLHVEAQFRWLVSYDDSSLIHNIYSGEKNLLFMNYFMHTARIGRELIIGSTDCDLPKQHFVNANRTRYDPNDNKPRFERSDRKLG
jgi:DNA adenine methylase